MKLYFLRHGKAEDLHSSGRDSERRLTREGIAEAKAECAGLIALDLQFDLVFSSPYPRALETAEITAEALRLPKSDIAVVSELAAGNFGLGELQELLENKGKALDADSKVLLVGHEPDFSTVVRRLTGACIELKKGGLAFVEATHIEPDSGVLRWLLTPRHLILAARSHDG